MYLLKIVGHLYYKTENFPEMFPKFALFRIFLFPQFLEKRRQHRLAVLRQNAAYQLGMMGKILHEQVQHKEVAA